MSDNHSDQRSDLWSDWLLRRRHADDPEYGRLVRATVTRYADHVLDGAHLAPDMTLADIGAGDGLVAFRAIDRVGPSLRVILTDISLPMLRHAEQIAVERGVRSQCEFLPCGAEKLEGIGDEAVEVVATRSVLAYVSDKMAALREFHRVLKPGGRISLAEPVFRDDALAASALRKALETGPPEARDRFMPLLHRWKAAQFPDTEEAIAQSPIAGYSERDLPRFALEAGFQEIHVELHIDVVPPVTRKWEVFLGNSPHPWASPLSEILKHHFNNEERKLFELVMRPTVEAGQSPTIDRMVYLTAKKPVG